MQNLNDFELNQDSTLDTLDIVVQVEIEADHYGIKTSRTMFFLKALVDMAMNMDPMDTGIQT